MGATCVKSLCGRRAGKKAMSWAYWCRNLERTECSL
jgi:hypothetical protein